MIVSTAVAIDDAVAKAWTEALGARSYTEALPFDEAGGDSLKILRVIFRLEQALGLTIPLNLIRTGMTPRDLMRAVEGLRRPPAADMDDRPVVFLIAAEAQEDPLPVALREALSDWFKFETIRVPRGGPTPDILDSVAGKIATKQPEGAVHVIGYGGGSLAALAIARRFERSRTRAGLAVLIEPRVEAGGGDEACLASEDLRVRAGERTIPVFSLAPPPLFEMQAERLGLSVQPLDVEAHSALDALGSSIVAAFVAGEATADATVP